MNLFIYFLKDKINKMGLKLEFYTPMKEFSLKLLGLVVDENESYRLCMSKSVLIRQTDI